MQNLYIGYHFKVEPKELGSEILIAELGELPFDSFIETENGFSAYIPKENWTENILEDIYILNNPEFKISYTIEEIEQKNWNAEWEKNFDPIDVDGLCHVRAPFHPKTDAKYDIVIEPKMSFGTGHHETTHMMIQHLLEMDVEGLKTLDMGCGTAILAILAEMKGAQPIDAIDIDNWCYLNSIENAERNNCKHISVYEGDASLLAGKKYDLIKDTSGFWKVTTDSISEGFHYYSLLIDGVAVADPASETFYGMGRMASGIEIPFSGGAYYALRNVPHGDIRIKKYFCYYYCFTFKMLFLVKLISL